MCSYNCDCWHICWLTHATQVGVARILRTVEIDFHCRKGPYNCESPYDSGNRFCRRKADSDSDSDSDVFSLSLRVRVKM